MLILCRSGEEEGSTEGLEVLGISVAWCGNKATMW